MYIKDTGVSLLIDGWASQGFSIHSATEFGLHSRPEPLACEFDIVKNLIINELSFAGKMFPTTVLTEKRVTWVSLCLT